MRAAIFSLVVLMAGCTSTHRDYAFHALNAADAYQTQDFRNGHCEERKWPTDEVLGKKPKPAETALYFLGVSWLFQKVSDRYDYAWLDWMMIGSKAYYVNRNHKQC